MSVNITSGFGITIDETTFQKQTVGIPPTTFTNTLTNLITYIYVLILTIFIVLFIAELIKLLE